MCTFLNCKPEVRSHPHLFRGRLNGGLGVDSWTDGRMNECSAYQWHVREFRLRRTPAQLAVTSSPAALFPSPLVPTELSLGVSELTLLSTVPIRLSDHQAQGQAIPAPRAPATVPHPQQPAALPASERSHAGCQRLRYPPSGRNVLPGGLSTVPRPLPLARQPPFLPMAGMCLYFPGERKGLGAGRWDGMG